MEAGGKGSDNGTGVVWKGKVKEERRKARKGQGGKGGTDVANFWVYFLSISSSSPVSNFHLSSSPCPSFLYSGCLSSREG